MKPKKQKLLDSLKKLIRNIYVQALIVSAVIVVFIPGQFDKYRLELIAKNTVKNPHIIKTTRSLIYSKDINGDGKDELIAPDNYKSRQSIHVYNHELKMIGQWNFNGNYLENCGMLEFSDVDNDKLKEIWGFSYRNDSLFLNATEPFDDKPFKLDNFFITSFSRKYYPKLDIELRNISLQDLDNDKDKELVFIIRAGYNLVPRKIFIYHPLEKNLLQRSLGGMNGGRVIRFSDFDGDDSKELIVKSYASANFPDSLSVKYRDDKAWLAAFNHDLSEVFPPKSFFSKYSNVRTAVINSENKNYIAIQAAPSGLTNDSTILQIIDKNGSVLSSLKMKDKIADNTLIFSSLNKGNTDHICILTRKGNFFILNRQLNIVARKEFKIDLKLATNNIYDYKYQSDLEKDKKPEYLLTNLTKDKIHVLSDDYKHITTYDLKDDKLIFLLPFHFKDRPPQLWAIGEKYIYKLNYGFNPLYYWQYAIYLVIYGGVLLFILAIRKLHEQQVREKYELRNQVERLKLQSLQNQMDPHFMLNATNSIGNIIIHENRKDAYNTLVRFSRLLRSMLHSSDIVLHGLHKELDFIKEYLHFQKLRFKDEVTYRINISNHVDLTILVPRMVIFTHVENALKHGIIPKDSCGNLDIDIRKVPDYVMIRIRDNGIGRKASARLRNQKNGYGMAILHEYFRIVNKHNKNHVSQQIRDLYDDAGKPAGTEVLVYIPEKLAFPSS